MQRNIKFQDLERTDLFMDAMYQTDRINEYNNDPVSKMYEIPHHK